MKAMVLCAGFGTRLGDLTKETPKPMLPLLGRPLLSYILAHLRDQGIKEIAVNLHFRPEAVQDYFGDGRKIGVRLEYFAEPMLLGTAGGLKNAERFFGGDEPFLVHYGDILTDQDFRPMLQAHQEHGALVTMLTHRREKSNSVVVLDADHRVTHFLERPDEATRKTLAASPWVNSGICICEPALLANIPAGVLCDLPRDVFPPLISTRRVFSHPLSGYRCAIDSPQRLAEAQAALTENRCRAAAE